LKSRNLKSKAYMKAKKNILIPLFVDKGITQCELRFKGCFVGFFLAFAHKKKRRDYSSLEELTEFNEVIVACQHCHNIIEHDRELTEKEFRRLRP